MRIAVLVGSTRDGRRGKAVADWVMRNAAGRVAVYELVDLVDQDLPHLSEPVPPRVGRYQSPRTIAWSAVVAAFDAFVIVTPEYNHQPPGVLKNALDHLYAEWSDTAVGFVSYGVAGGVRAVEQLRQLAGVLGMADVRPQVDLPLATAFTDEAVVSEGPHLAALEELLTAVESWAAALAPLRHGRVGV